MTIKKETVKQGFFHSLHITFELSKVIVPAFIVVTLIKHTPIFNLVAAWGQPFMKWFGLPGEAAMPITVGMLFNQYLAIGALSAMNLTTKEVTVSAVILCICHELLIESAVVKKTGIKVWPFILTRLAFACIGAYTLNALWTAL